MPSASYWLQEPLIAPLGQSLESASILIIGSGLTGTALAHFLSEAGFRDLLLYDSQPKIAASFRNSGHILPGTVESYHRLKSLKGLDDARLLWRTSVEGCELFRELTESLNIACDYRRDGYLVHAISASEWTDIQASVRALGDDGYKDQLLASSDVEKYGFRNVLGARFDPLGASVNPLKFRNGLLKHNIQKGLKYHSGSKIMSVSREGSGVRVVNQKGEQAHFDIALIASNAYANEVLGSKQLSIEPVRGQMLWSSPWPGGDSLFPGPHSFEFGYEYGLLTAERRLILGGWRQNTPGREKLDPTSLDSKEDLQVNPSITQGLTDFAKTYYTFGGTLKWEGAWTGLMGATQTGIPYVFELNQGQIYFCGAYTGHGLPWSLKCAQILSKWLQGMPIRDGESLRRLLQPPIWRARTY